ncbi:pq loop repeat-containing protein [Stemphylium lycopersici]|nr:pq loop repeat-containing protein [Stemphylium lycopersici]
MFFISAIVKNIAPVFIATSPITSYGDQIYSMHRARSSAGFSLDIPLIMLVASILKVYYWFGAHFSTSLLIQALLMICVHLLLLHVALANRPPPSHLPFQHKDVSNRPYDFWQWRAPRPYWAFITYFTGALLVCHLVMSNTAVFVPYTDVLGAVALTIEATLPLPQLWANYQRRGCKGFRPSVIVNWVIGDTFKMWFFFASAKGEVPLAFKACGIFQACCDLGLAAQYLVWGDGPVGVDGAGREKEIRSPLPLDEGWSQEKLGQSSSATAMADSPNRFILSGRNDFTTKPTAGQTDTLHQGNNLTNHHTSVSIHAVALAPDTPVRSQARAHKKLVWAVDKLTEGVGRFWLVAEKAKMQLEWGYIYTSDITPIPSYEDFTPRPAILSLTSLPSRVGALNKRAAIVSANLAHLTAVVKPLETMKREEIVESHLNDIWDEGYALGKAMEEFKEQIDEVSEILRDMTSGRRKVSKAVSGACVAGEDGRGASGKACGKRRGLGF